MANNIPNLNDGESYVDGRSQAKAQELIELVEKAGFDASRVVTTSHGYIVPSKALEADVEEEAAPSEAEEADDDSVVEFDPSTASVREVKEYLDGADAKERERVLAAEEAGKARKGILADTSEGDK